MSKKNKSCNIFLATVSNSRGQKGWGLRVDDSKSHIATDNDFIDGLTSILKQVKCNTVFIISNEKYVIDSIGQWMCNWKQKNWVKSNGGEVANKKQFKKIYAMAVEKNIYTIGVYHSSPDSEYKKILNNIMDEIEDEL